MHSFHIKLACGIPVAYVAIITWLCVIFTLVQFEDINGKRMALLLSACVIASRKQHACGRHDTPISCLIQSPGAISY